MAKAVCLIEQVWGHLIIKFTRCQITVTGRENIPKEGGACFVSNHGGYFDIVLLLAYSGRRIGFIAKKELMLIPILNIWIFITGGLFIDRRSPRKAAITIHKGVQKIKSGSCIIIFPEGSRAKEHKLNPFHHGALKLATLAHAPIVPVAIKGSYNVWEKTKRVVPSSMEITFCKPIYTAEIPPGDRKQILSDRIYDIIKEKLGL